MLACFRSGLYSRQVCVLSPDRQAAHALMRRLTASSSSSACHTSSCRTNAIHLSLHIGLCIFYVKSAFCSPVQSFWRVHIDTWLTCRRVHIPLPCVGSAIFACALLMRRVYLSAKADVRKLPAVSKVSVGQRCEHVSASCHTEPPHPRKGCNAAL